MVVPIGRGRQGSANDEAHPPKSALLVDEISVSAEGPSGCRVGGLRQHFYLVVIEAVAVDIVDEGSPLARLRPRSPRATTPVARGNCGTRKPWHEETVARGNPYGVA